MGISKITSWVELKKTHASCVPHNYVYKLQGLKTVDEYSSSFYHVLARNNLSDFENQMVIRYIKGLLKNIQDSLDLFNPISIFDTRKHCI